MKTYVLYHKNCTDGFGAAYSAWKKFYDNAIYIPVAYDEPIPEIEPDSTVYVVDFCLSKVSTQLVQKGGSKVITLDHHIASEQNIKFSDECVFDMQRSGAKIAWEYFHPNTTNKMIDYISDKDLGRFLLPKSREILAGLESYVRDFKIWDNLNEDQLLQEGTHILRSKSNEISLLVDKSYLYKMGEFTIPVVNTAVFMSEVADKLLEVYPDAKFSATYNIYERNGKLYKKWSLRSKKVDVNEVAKKYNGGGHQYAAAFIEEITFNKQEGK